MFLFGFFLIFTQIRHLLAHRNEMGCHQIYSIGEIKEEGMEKGEAMCMMTR
jgi:hypothetical protein